MEQTMRQQMVEVVSEQLAERADAVVVLAAISASQFSAARERHPGRVIDVGIREQSLIGVAAGLSACGLRPLVHTYAPFLVERPFEQIKVDLCHQRLGAVLVSIGASYDEPEYGRTHFCPEDVALLSTLPDATVHVPGHPQEAGALIRAAMAREGVEYIRLSLASNASPHLRPDGSWLRLRRGNRGTVVAVGPMLDRVLEAACDLDVTVLYASTVRPLDASLLLESLSGPNLVMVEPYLAGSSAPQLASLLGSVPLRTLHLGVGELETHRYGSMEEHHRAQGLDAASLRARISTFLDQGPANA